MAERERKGICCVIRARWFLEFKQCLCHLLHLGFRGFSVTNNCLFDLGRCIHSNGTIRIRRREFHNTFNFTYSERTAYIFTKKNILKHYALDGEFGNQIGYGIVNLFQPYLWCCFWASSDVSEAPRNETIRVRFNHAVSSIRNARINAKNYSFNYPLRFGQVSWDLHVLSRISGGNTPAKTQRRCCWFLIIPCGSVRWV